MFAFLLAEEVGEEEPAAEDLQQHAGQADAEILDRGSLNIVLLYLE